MMNLLSLFLTFLKIGAFTFGGGYAMLPLIQSEVQAHAWMSQEAIVNFIAVSESTPGPFAINIATYVGSQVGGIAGSFCATLGVVLPSFVIILIVARIYDAFKSSRLVKGFMSAVKPAAVGLIMAAVLSIGKTVFLPLDPASAKPYLSLAIAVLSVILVFKKLHPIAVIGIGAAIGLIAGYCGLIPIA